MRWKILLFVFLLAFLAGLIYFKALKLPTFSSITGFFSRILASQKPVYFQLSLDAITTEQSFQLLNATLSLSGTCITPITIGKVSIQTASLPCKIEMYSPNGRIKVSGKNAFVEATSPLVRINGVDYTTSDKISFQVNVDLLTASVFAQNLNFHNFEGKFEKLLDGSVSTVINFPPCEKIELLDFSGTLIIGEQTVLLGSAKVSYWCENVKNKV